MGGRNVLNVARKTLSSPATQAHLERLHRSLRGKEPKAATAATLATRKLKAMGLARSQAPKLWDQYRNLYFERRNIGRSN